VKQVARGASAALAVAAWLGIACAGAAPSSPQQVTGAGDAAQLVLPEIRGASSRPLRVLFLGISGLTPGDYLGEAGRPAPMPLLASMAAAGAAALAVGGVAPGSVYPASASLITGRLPGAHGIVADRRIGSRGVRSARYSHASQLRAATLWQRAAEAGLRVAALGWPTTEGAALPLLLPDAEPERQGEHWLDAVAEGTEAQLLAALRGAAADLPAAALDQPGAARDALLIESACELLARPDGPALLLLHLSGVASETQRWGRHSQAAERAAAAADREVARLLACSARGVPLGATAVVVAGDRGLRPVHTQVSPNTALVSAGLLEPGARWSALVRSNGSSAFVYASSERAALRARSELQAAARQSRAFRVVPAEELLPLGVDPDAWFGLRAEPGYLFSDAVGGGLLAAAERRAEGGALAEPDDTGWLAWGRGVRSGLRIPHMRVTDAGPTAAALLGLELAPQADLDGRALIGLLDLPPATPARAR